MPIHRPEVPVINHSSGQQNANPARDRAEEGKPPGPAVDAFKRGVEAHGPAPEQAATFRRRAAVQRLFDFTLTTITAECQNGCRVHRKEQDGTIKEHDRKRVEGIVEQIAVTDGESRRPIQMREDAEGYRFAPASHGNRADEAQHQVKPDGASKGPSHMRAHAKLTCAAIGAHPPKQY